VRHHLNPRVIGGDLLGHLGAAVRGGVIDDEDPHIDSRLVAQDAGRGLAQEVAVVVTGDNDAHRAHRGLSLRFA
jgi:hypothetical protein